MSEKLPVVSFKVSCKLNRVLRQEASDDGTDLSKYCRFLLKLGRKVSKRRDLMIEILEPADEWRHIIMVY